MKIGVMGGCGGIGKSTISLTLAKALNAYLITNDPTNPLGKVYEDFKYMNKIKIIDNEDYNFIYDFAGHITPEMIEASKKCDIVIIITDNTNHAITGAGLLLNNLKCKDVFIINNSIGNNMLKYNSNVAYDNFMEIKNAFGKRFNIDILPLKYTRLAMYAIDSGESLLDRTYTQKGTINKNYRLENAQLKAILKRINKEKKRKKLWQK
jgi:MinD-like ATPase involved in chromosome partitioning or flagellar assembly